MKLSHTYRVRHKPVSRLVVMMMFIVATTISPWQSVFAATNPVDVTYTKVGDVKDCGIMQGGTTDGQYFYFACMEDNNVNKVRIVKTTLAGEIVQKSDTFTEKQIGHANDLTYNSKQKLLVVSTWVKGGHEDTISLMDPSTLEVTDKKTTSDGGITPSLCYNATTDQYLINGKLYDTNFQFIKRIYTSSGVDDDTNTKDGDTVNQGIECNESYIYVMRVVWGRSGYTLISVYDWTGANIGIFKVNLAEEAENLAFLNKSLYMGMNRGKMGGKSGDSSSYKDDYFIKLDGIGDKIGICSPSARAGRNEQYEAWGVVFYLPSCDCSTSTSAPISTDMFSSPLPQTTLDDIKRADIDGKLAKMIDVYKSGGSKTNIPWQFLAALHWREANMSPGTSIANGEPLKDGRTVDGLQISSDANEDAAIAAKHFIDGAQSTYKVDITGPTSSMDDIGKAFLAYNRGSMYDNWNQPYTSSPYVMNGYDAEHMKMKWIEADSYESPEDKAAGKRPVNDRSGKEDGNPIGALTILKYLYTSDSTTTGSSIAAGSASSNCSSSSVPQGSVAALQEKILAYAHHTYQAGKQERTAAYTAAVKKAQADGRYVGGCNGVDCGGFITTIMIDSGWDPTYNSSGKGGNVPIQEAWLKENWQYLGYVGTEIDATNLQIGDVAINDEHTFMFAGDIPDFTGKIASASLCDRAPMAQDMTLTGEYVAKFRWYRKNNPNPTP